MYSSFYLLAQLQVNLNLVLHPTGKPLKLPLQSGVLLGLELAEDFVGEVALEAAAYAVDLDGTERAASSEWKKKTLKIQASYGASFLESHLLYK